MEAATRFGFGANWQRFLSTVDEQAIQEAIDALAEMLGGSLEGRTFLDAGCGSGLSSLAALSLGAERVYSFDYDPQSVAATQRLRERSGAGNWTVEQGDATDAEYCASLGRFDVVYSWGVLHHTGAMWQAMENVSALVAPGGHLFISIYNDQGRGSTIWRLVKRTYNRLPAALRRPYVMLVGAWIEVGRVWGALSLRRPLAAFSSLRAPQGRGMSRWHDLVDWVGGYPFEVATPDAIFGFCRERGFELRKLRTRGGGRACNEFVFERPALSAR